jgi:hypothetical protein
VVSGAAEGFSRTLATLRVEPASDFVNGQLLHVDGGITTAL